MQLDNDIEQLHWVEDIAHNRPQVSEYSATHYIGTYIPAKADYIATCLRAWGFKVRKVGRGSRGDERAYDIDGKLKLKYTSWLPLSRAKYVALYIT